MTEDYKTAQELATDFFRRDIDSLTIRIHDALSKQRKEISFSVQSLWSGQGDSNLDETYLKVAAMIRGEKYPPDMVSYTDVIQGVFNGR